MPRIALATVAVALMAAAPAAAATGRPRIVNGHPPTGDSSYMAYLRVTFPGGEGICSGSLIGARWVLTAAHCLTDDASGQVVTPDKVRVLVGHPDVTGVPDAQYRPASAVHVFPGYQRSGSAFANHDTGIVQLAAPAPQLSQLRYPRPQDSAAWAPGAQGSVLGWGRTSGSATTTSPVVNETELTVFSDQACGVDRIDGWDASLLFCAAQGNHYTCQGDSGGPFVVGGPQPTVAGVVSGVSFNCDGLQLQTFTDSGDPGMNAFVRTYAPQVEVDASPAAPQPGDVVTLSYAGRDPDAADQRHATLRWDLDGNGTFGDATGPQATLPVSAGVYRVGLEGSDGAGNDERRVIALDVRPHTAASMASAAPLRVREGQPIVVTATTDGGGFGTVAATAAGQTARPGRDFFAGPLQAPLSFARGQTTRTVLVPTRDDWRREAPRTLALGLASPTGQLVLGPTTSRAVTIVDDDDLAIASGRTLRARHGHVPVRVDVRRTGRATLTLQRAVRGRIATLGRARPSLRHRGRTTVRIALTRPARRLLARSRRGLRVQIAVLKGGDAMGPPLKRRLRR